MLRLCSFLILPSSAVTFAISTALDVGKYWCWVFWEIDVRKFDFLRSESKELLCRAWDEDMNTQPAAITWNLMGMMNNCYHR